MSCCSFDLSISNLVLLCVLIFTGKKLFKLFNQWKLEKMLEKWDTKSKNKIVIHNMWRCKTVPNLSPYGLKLETYLKMAKLPYETDIEDMMGPKGKLPWLSDNGQHIADSQFCIEHIRKKYNVDVNSKFSKEQLAVARSVRIMLEDRFVFGLQWLRVVETTVQKLSEVTKVPQILKLMLPLMKYQVRKRLEQNGIGMHTPTEIYQLTEDDLRATSLILGKNKFFCGDEPCEDDCAIFGMLAQCVWSCQGSSYERLVHGELSNLKEYCERMKELFWPDWEACLDRS